MNARPPLHRWLGPMLVALVVVPAAAQGPDQSRDAFVTTHENTRPGRHRRLYRVPLQRGEPAQLLFEGQDVPRVLGRMSEDRIVVSGARGPEVFDLVDETAEPMFDPPVVAGEDAVLEWVGFLDGAAFARSRPSSDRFGSGSLLRFEPGRPTETLHASGVNRVVDVRRDGIWYLVDEPMSIWTVVHRAGTAREIVRLPQHVEAMAAGEESRGLLFAQNLDLAVALSPSGRRVALATPWTSLVATAEGEEPEPGGSVLVHDTVTGEIVAQRTGVNIAVSPVSSSMPRFEMVWASDRVLRLSETDGGRVQGTFQWVDWDVVRDQRLEVHPYAWGLNHETPDSAPPKSDRRGVLVHGGLRLLRSCGPDAHGLELAFDAEQDVRRGSTGEIHTDPAAQWAIAQPVGAPDVYRVGATGKPEAIGRGWILRVEFR